MSKQQTRQLNISGMEPQLLHEFDVWYQRLKIDALEHDLSVPLKQDTASKLFRVGFKVIDGIGHFVDQWILSSGEVSLGQAEESATRITEAELSREELRRQIKSYFQRQTDELVEIVLPYFERTLREKHGH